MFACRKDVMRTNSNDFLWIYNSQWFCWPVAVFLSCAPHAPFVPPNTHTYVCVCHFLFGFTLQHNHSAVILVFKAEQRMNAQYYFILIDLINVHCGFSEVCICHARSMKRDYQFANIALCFCQLKMLISLLYGRLICLLYGRLIAES